MTLVSIAGYSDPKVWNIHDNNGRMLMRTEELTSERTVHLRGKIEVEIEDRMIRFEIHEDEQPETTFSHLFRRLGISREYWQLVNLHGEIIEETDGLIPGKKYFAVTRNGDERSFDIPISIRVHFKLRDQSIPVLPMETFECVMLAIELALNVPEAWKLFDRCGIEVTQKAQLHDRQEYWVRQKEMKMLKALVRTDDYERNWKLFQVELDQIRTRKAQTDRHNNNNIIITFTRESPVGFHQLRQIAPRKGQTDRQQLMEECSARLRRWMISWPANGKTDQQGNDTVQDLVTIWEIRNFVVPPRMMTTGKGDKAETLVNRRRVRKQKQKAKLAMIKNECAETTTLYYQTQQWKTKGFKLSELPPKELNRRFRRWVQQCTGVQVDQQEFDRWTMSNLEIGDICGTTCVLLPPGYDYKLPKKVQFDENDKLLSRFRLFRPRKPRFWNPNRRPHSRGIRLFRCIREEVKASEHFGVLRLSEKPN
jgi:hypothetical protein